MVGGMWGGDMNRRHFLALTTLLPLTACQSERHAWRQKLTLVIDTPQGEVTGSSVVAIRVIFYDDPPPLTQTEVEYGVTGEATVVEVLPGRYLFALLGGSEQRFYAATQDRFGRMERGEWLREIPKQTEPADLLPDHLPMLVTFDDITKPETVREVNPADLAAVFGPGVRLKAVTLEITGEEVTEGKVEGILDWWKGYENKQLDGDRYGNIESKYPFANSLNRLDFIRIKR
jgi:hypothetical protein